MSDKATLRRLLRELNDAVFVEDHEKLEERIVNLFDAVREERDQEIDLLKSTIQDNEAYFMQLRAELEAVKAELQLYKDDRASVLAEECAPDEQHCTCVPGLRAEIKSLNAELQRARERANKLNDKCAIIADYLRAKHDPLPETQWKQGYQAAITAIADLLFFRQTEPKEGE